MGKRLQLISCFTRPSNTFFLHIRSRKQTTWQPSHCRSFEFFAWPTQVASRLLPIFLVLFRISNSLFQDSLFSSIKLPIFFFETTRSTPSNTYQSSLRLRLFMFKFLCGYFSPYLCLLFPLELFSIFSTSTILLLTDVSSPRFHFFTVYLLQLSFFIMAESKKHRAASRMFQSRWEEEYFLSSSIVNTSVWFAKSL